MTVPLVARRPRLAGAVVAAGLVVAGWTALATWWAPRVTPTVPEVVRQVWNDRSFYVPHLRTTLVEAAWGYVLGNVAAIVVAIGCLALTACTMPVTSAPSQPESPSAGQVVAAFYGDSYTRGHYSR